MPPEPPKRAPTQVGADRDVRTVKTPPRNVGLTEPMPMSSLAVPHEVKDPITGIIPIGPELDAARAKRASEDPQAAIAILERKSDETKRWQDLYVGLLEKLAARTERREELTFTTELKIKGNESDDRLHANRARRKWIGQMVAFAFGGGTLIEVLHRFGVL